MEILTIGKDTPRDCLLQAQKVFLNSVYRFRSELAAHHPLPKPETDAEKLAAYHKIMEAGIDAELENAIKNPGSDAIFIGIEERRGKKEVVAVSHVRFKDAGIPKGWIYVQWIGALKFEKKYEHKDQRNLPVEVLSKPHLPKEKGWGDKLLEAILSKYKEKRCAGAYTICPGKDSKTLSFFKKDHKFKETGAGGDGFVRLERGL